ncbi:hypothetical protein [Ochrobactrum sp. RH2CCR150]|uniref:hypothetical protein n=1 Tax=Ochrobactrum sp. RH2CCR150 TaxID=2587044 RepID=UPI0015FE7C5F|nr:hypothetical protein [Ochrobactrum sp. RH2CCR150]
MAVTLLHGTGNLVCDDVDAGRVEFSIASPADGPDMTRRGKVWGNRQAIAASMDWGGLREGAESYAKVSANDIHR